MTCCCPRTRWRPCRLNNYLKNHLPNYHRRRLLAAEGCGYDRDRHHHNLSILSIQPHLRGRTSFSDRTPERPPALANRDGLGQNRAHLLAHDLDLLDGLPASAAANR